MLKIKTIVCEKKYYVSNLKIWLILNFPNWNYRLPSIIVRSSIHMLREYNFVKTIKNLSKNHTLRLSNENLYKSI